MLYTTLSRALAYSMTKLFYICSFDVRGMPLDQAHHYSAPDVFGNRASFRTTTAPACLLVDEVQRNDEGVYRCRVDFRNSATKSFRYNLSVIGK
ncbi:synaptogenesis protein syg-2-like [Aphis craccivora]|uniref:Synaptogenesis protein syg-2-like n=1 Tax=Aphis craccivora TaxID=307492 RepID=A0A6G0ZK98_APHCR|nr:synaptogenesis protein syg-2-like [Aphis craccivora]